MEIIIKSVGMAREEETDDREGVGTHSGYGGVWV